MQSNSNCLVGGGAAGEYLRSIDWNKTALGPVDGWPLSLQTAIRIVLGSKFPMMIHWGPELITFYNDAYAPSLGKKHPGNLGRPAKEWWSEMWDDLVPIFDKVLSGEAHYVEDARYTPDRYGARQEAFFTHCHSPLWDDQGRIAGIFLVVTETTRRVVAERDLLHANTELEKEIAASRTSASRLDALISASSELLYKMSADWGEMRPLVNGTFLKDTGVVNPNWMAEYIPADEQSRVREAIRDAIAAKAIFSLEHRVNRGEAGVGWTFSRAIPILDAEGGIVEWLGAASDITERRLAESALRDSEARLRSMNEMLEQNVQIALAEQRRTEEQLRQSQKMEAVGQLTGGMAHDFNNLLQAISGCLQLVSRRAGHVTGVQKILDSGRQAVDRGASLIRQLMAFSRRQSLQPEAFDVRDQLLGMRNFLDRALRADIRLEFDLEAGLWPVMADPVQFELAVLNLATNARDALEPGGQLVIGAGNTERTGEDGLHGAFVRVWVRDNGRGIDSETLGRVFEPFFTTKAVGQGTGLGLAQVYGFCRQSGGTATAESVVGQGTTVTLLLPRAELTATEKVESQAAMIAGSGARVLLVEDDPVVAPVIMAALEDLDYHVNRAASGDEALRRLREGEEADVLFSDVVMPGKIDGIALARAAQSLLPSIAVVLTTGYSEDHTGLEGFPVLAKPYRIEELASVIHGELTRRRKRETRQG